MSNTINAAPPKLRWVWLGLFCTLIALLGGSSRPDMAQIAALRPLSAVLLIPALYFVSRADLKAARFLIGLFALFAFWMLLQLVPLPPSLWHALPDRGIIASLDAIIDGGEMWRPIALVPSRGWNALASLVVPAAALLLALSLRANARMLLLLIAGLGALDALLGLLQVISGPSSPLYFYSITNRGSPVGIFANENHSAVFSSIAMMVVAYLGLSSRKFVEPAWLRLIYAPVFVGVLLAVLVSGSRAGIALGCVALVVVAMMAYMSIGSKHTNLAATGRSRRSSGRKRRDGWPQVWLASHPQVLLILGAGLIFGILAAFILLGRSAGFADVFNQNAFADLRWELLPVLLEMARNHWLLGTGFGSFEEVYHLYEPTSLLMPFYINQAHNDWLQLLIEGGLPAVLMLAALIAWVAGRLVVLYRNSSSTSAQIILYSAAIGVIAGSSLVDYALRTPSFQAICVWLLLSLAQDGKPQESLAAKPN